PSKLPDYICCVRAIPRKSRDLGTRNYGTQLSGDVGPAAHVCFVVDDRVTEEDEVLQSGLRFCTQDNCRPIAALRDRKPIIMSNAWSRHSFAGCRLTPRRLGYLGWMTVALAFAHPGGPCRRLR